MQPRKHSAAIHAFADGHTIQWRKPGDIVWNDFVMSQHPTFQDDCEYRIKPAGPEYPEIENDGALNDAAWVLVEALPNPIPPRIWNNVKLPLKAAIECYLHKRRAVPERSAIATLMRLGYTDCGGEQWKPPLGLSSDQRAARELAIAKAVRKATIAASFVRGMTAHFEEVDLESIIASIP
jgi:hypothetical protein